MASGEITNFLTGVIEGFYGQPWSQAERFELFEWMASWGLNTYLYAPKDDLKHRALWRETYSKPEATTLGELISACKQRNLRFIYALSPGLDIRYSNEAEIGHLKERFAQMLTIGCQHFALLFDDIPDRMDMADQKRWPSFASAQCHVVNAVFKWTRERSPNVRFLFCPTPYCSRMAARNLGGEGYLPTVGRELLSEINVFWTGPEIISREITAAHVQELQKLLRRKPLIWDNLHANDYDGRRFFCGPYSGRPSELRSAVAGLLSNPNCEFPLNYIPLRTLGELAHCEGKWDSRAAYLSALREWLPRFATINQPLTFEDLVLFFDCYYLPHEEGKEAETLYERTRSLLATNPEKWSAGQVAAFREQATRLHELCIRLTELQDRRLFYALSRRIWELREELDLLLQYAAAKSGGGRTEAPSLTSHLPDTYRGGLVAKLQRLLIQRSDGKFISTNSDAFQNIDTAERPSTAVT